VSRDFRLLVTSSAALAFLLMSIEEGEAALQKTNATFSSGGRKITAEIFSPGTPGKYPGVLVLHGAGGMLMDGPAIHRFARVLAEHGLTACAVHYFNRTGTVFARDAAIQKHFDAWLDTVNDAVDFLARRPEVNPHAIGCFGYSLGGYLALAQGARDARIGAVVELAGGIDNKHAHLVSRLPPVLILHGSGDGRVSVELAYQLEKIAQRVGAPWAMHVYQNEGHVLSSASQADAAGRAVTFLREHLLSASR
jgi:dienelactone hydrolase